MSNFVWKINWAYLVWCVIVVIIAMIFNPWCLLLLTVQFEMKR